jgi:hypothetical protein
MTGFAVMTKMKNVAVRRERVRVRVLLDRWVACESTEPSPLPSPGIPGEGVAVRRAQHFQSSEAKDLEIETTLGPEILRCARMTTL